MQEQPPSVNLAAASSSGFRRLSWTFKRGCTRILSASAHVLCSGFYYYDAKASAKRDFCELKPTSAMILDLSSLTTLWCCCCQNKWLTCDRSTAFFYYYCCPPLRLKLWHYFYLFARRRLMRRTKRRRHFLVALPSLMCFSWLLQMMTDERRKRPLHDLPCIQLVRLWCVK